jgi:hypothetical protein
VCEVNDMRRWMLAAKTKIMIMQGNEIQNHDTIELSSYISMHDTA